MLPFYLTPKKIGEPGVITLSKEVLDTLDEQTVINILFRLAGYIIICIERIQTLSPDSQRRLLLVGDQFEEIYTLCLDASDRKIFLDGLLQAVKNAPFFTLVLTLRADSEEQQEKAQRVFIQLVQPGEGTEDTRKLATSDEVGDNWDLVTHLADERLVVTNRNELTNEETVEVVHEALIRHWGRLRGWMQENRKFSVWQEGLKVALQQWVESNKDDGALLRGATLAVAEDWLQQRGEEVSKAQRWFIEKSVGLRERERKQKERLRLSVIAGLSMQKINIYVMISNVEVIHLPHHL
ncbi:MAG: hypothetical protein SAK29_26325 [Scytonema sp. PMC 1069.18]|nr:hypothetical protein [Scytonema sp. PMC 1069.18]MEC4884739.1 hypothetical protein [Scytonema sp. PMC 1070.18]